MKTTKKVDVIPVTWKHHLEGGGWEWVCSHITKHFHFPNSKIKIYTAYEYQVREKIFEPHIAWFHQVLNGPERCLINLVKSPFWKNNTRYLLYAITVSKYQEVFLRKHGIHNISTIYHPTPLNVLKWEWDKFNETKAVYHIGFHCRNIDFFKDLAEKIEGDFSFNYLVPKDSIENVAMPSYIRIIPRVRPEKYEDILKSSVVFMNLTDATANNAVLECIARGTPVLVNPIGGIKEYLGKDYPLYYNSLDEAVSLLDSIKSERLLKVSHDYLLKIRQNYSIEHFMDKLNGILEDVKYEV